MHHTVSTKPLISHCFDVFRSALTPFSGRPTCKFFAAHPSDYKRLLTVRYQTAFFKHNCTALNIIKAPPSRHTLYRRSFVDIQSCVAVFEKLRSDNKMVRSAYNHLICCEEFTFTRISLRMVSVDTETRIGTITDM
jgi:hypothetical protein